MRDCPTRLRRFTGPAAEARDALWIKVDAVKKELEREMCAYDHTEVPALPARASNGALAVVQALADAAEGHHRRRRRV